MECISPLTKRLHSELSYPASHSSPQAMDDDNEDVISSAAAASEGVIHVDTDIVSLPVDLLGHILSFLTANEVEHGVALTCSYFCDSVRHGMCCLWKTYCEITEVNEYIGVRQQEKDDTTTTFVTVMPGQYEEDIIVEGIQVRYQAVQYVENECTVSIACNGTKSRWSQAPNQPAIKVVSDEGYITRASFEGFDINHSSPGNDIWGGNCGVFCYGENSAVLLERCNIHSSSGRGVVCTGGANATVRHCNIYRSAATGMYVGDLGSYGELIQSHIILNGHGYGDSIPPGHSGIYIENATAYIEDCLISANSLTGLSVIRSGIANLIRCDCTLNGAVHPVTVDDNGEEHHRGILDGSDLRSSSGNSIVKNFLTNNFRPIGNGHEALENIAHGGRIRPMIPKLLEKKINNEDS